MIEALPLSKWFNEFEFRQNGRWVGELKPERLWRRRAVVVGQERYRLRGKGFTGSAFVLEQDGKILARAVRRGVRDEFEMELGAGGFTIRYTSVADHRFDVFRGDAEVGSVRCVRPESRRTRIALPPHWPLREQIFVFWLALFMRERALASRWG